MYVKRVRLAGGTRGQRSGAESCETLDMSGYFFWWTSNFGCADTSNNRRREDARSGRRPSVALIHRHELHL
jgi:hypothetical protein